MDSLAKTLVTIGFLLIAVGGVVWIFSKVGIPLGRMPGDLQIKGEHTSFYFPIVTSLLISVILTVGINLLLWLFRR